MTANSGSVKVWRMRFRRPSGLEVEAWVLGLLIAASAAGTLAVVIAWFTAS